MSVAVATAITNYLKETSTSGTELATRLGTSPTEISRWKRGRVVPGAEWLERLKAEIPANYFEGTSSYLSSRDGEVATWINQACDLTRKLYALNADPFFNDSIHIVTASSALHSQFADERSRNFIYMDNYSDRDATPQVSLDIARSSPGVEVTITTSQTFDDRYLDRCLVCIGGPSLIDPT